MLALAIMTKSKYISLRFPTSIYIENNLEDLFYFLDLNEATKEAMDDVRKSKKIPQILDLTSTI